MDYARVTIAEAADCFIAGDLPTGESVRVTTFIDMKSATSPVLTTNTATEIGATGKYYWCLDEMETSPAREMIVLWIMTAPVSGRTTWGVLHIGGYPSAILEDTGTRLPATLATIDGIVDSILEDTGTTIPGTITTIDGIVDSILEDTGTTLPASLTSISGKVDTVDGIVDSILEDTGTTLPATLATIDGIVDNIIIDTAVIGTGVSLDGGQATVCGMLVKMADDNGGADFNAETDSLTEIAASEATPPTVEQIAAQIERAGGMLETAKDAAVSSQEEAEEVNAKLEAGSLAPDSVQFEPTV